jgi:hypothetical protein
MASGDIIDLPGNSPDPEEREENPLAVAKTAPPDLLLIIFIHGYMSFSVLNVVLAYDSLMQDSRVQTKHLALSLIDSNISSRSLSPT